MSLQDIVNVTIQTETAGVPRASFSTLLILSPHQLFADRIRFYTSLTGMVSDGFTSTTPEYKAAAAAFSQTPRPERVAIGKLLNRPTQQFELTPTAANSTAYKVKVNGTEVTFTSDGSATVAEITAGLKTAVDALSVTGLTTTDTGSLLRFTMTTGLFLSLEVDPATMSSLLSLVQNHADPGAAADLAAIKLVDNTWYGIVNLFNSKLMVEAIAGWAESETAPKLFVAQTQDSPVINTSVSGTDDVAEALQSSARMRTAVIWHSKTDAFADAAWAGRLLPTDPGSESWALKNLSGVTACQLTTTQKTNARAKYVTTYFSVGGTGRTDNKMGKVSGNEWIDIIRLRDAIKSDIEVDVTNVLTAQDKVPFTDPGIAAIQAAIAGVLEKYVGTGGIARSPAYKVTVPKASAVSTADKAARTLTGVKFDATLAGAIQATTITGTLSL